MKKGIVSGLSALMGVIVGAAGSAYIGSKTISQKNEKIDKFKTYYNMLNQWLIIKLEGKSIESYFIENNYSKIAIYGMGEMGNRLYEELKSSKIEIKYAIDKNADSAYSELVVVDLEDALDEVDVVIVTAVFAFDEIEKAIQDKIDCPIISLEDVVYEV